MFQKKNAYSKIGAVDFVESLFIFWMRWYKTVFFVVFLIICGWSVFLWYYSLYHFKWSAEQKQSYIDSQSHWTTLQGDDFKRVLDVIEHRKAVHQTDPNSVRDIFMIQPEEK